jgi:hypothetical protein
MPSLRASAGILDTPTPDGRTVAELFVEHMIANAIKGNAAYARQIMERIDGRVQDKETEPELSMEAIARLLEERYERCAREDLDDSVRMTSTGI